jgi:hypothetical protein
VSGHKYILSKSSELSNPQGNHNSQFQNQWYTSFAFLAPLKAAYMKLKVNILNQIQNTEVVSVCWSNNRRTGMRMHTVKRWHNHPKYLILNTLFFLP